MALDNSDPAEPPPFQAHRRPARRPWPITALCIGLALVLVVLANASAFHRDRRDAGNGPTGG